MTKKANALRIARDVCVTALLGAVWATIDFGLTFLYSLIPEVNDGIIGPSFLMCLLWGEDGWSRVRYFEVFRGAVVAAFGLLCLTLLLFAIRARLPKEE